MDDLFYCSMTLRPSVYPENSSLEYEKIRRELEILADEMKNDPTDAELYIKMKELYDKIHRLKP